jgi:hypothetical protein
LSALPNPVTGQGYSDPSSLSGVTLRVGLGAQTGLFSYPTGGTVVQASRALAQAACAGRPEVAASLVDVAATRAADGGWIVQGRLRVRTSGIGVTVGEEHFTGPAYGEGSSLQTPFSVATGLRWGLAPARLDGGAGQLPVSFSGSSCPASAGDLPDRLPVRVTTATQGVYPFTVPLDVRALRAAVATACASASFTTSATTSGTTQFGTSTTTDTFLEAPTG